MAVQLRVLGLVHHAHPARSQLAKNRVVEKRLANKRVWIHRLSIDAIGRRQWRQCEWRLRRLCEWRPRRLGEKAGSPARSFSSISHAGGLDSRHGQRGDNPRSPSRKPTLSHMSILQGEAGEELRYKFRRIFGCPSRANQICGKKVCSKEVCGK
jgi:hypothetical protein